MGQSQHRWGHCGNDPLKGLGPKEIVGQIVFPGGQGTVGTILAELPRNPRKNTEKTALAGTIGILCSSAGSVAVILWGSYCRS